METHEIEVGAAGVDEDALLALSRARTVMGPSELLTAVRHLCPPTATLRERSAPGVPEGTVGPVVVLRPPVGRHGEEGGALQQLVDRAAAAVDSDDRDGLRVAAQARAHHDALAKPPGSLGVLEDVGVRLCVLAGACPPPVPRAPAVLVAAADHGAVASGVSAWPSEVTGAMVGACLTGDAAVAVLAERVGVRLQVLDVGVATDVVAPESRSFVRRPVRRGTRDLAHEPPMTLEEAEQAVLVGAGAADALMDEGADLLVTGDLGIGNTTASACLVAALTGEPAERLVGRGAGADDAVMARKRGAVAAALARVRRGDTASQGGEDGLGILASCGGLEHAALVGLMLAGRARRTPVVLDGVTPVAAALVATRVAPGVGRALIAGHRSVEPAAGTGLDALGLHPLLDLRLRLGEGTGGVLAVPLVVAAAAAMVDMGSLGSVAGGA